MSANLAPAKTDPVAAVLVIQQMEQRHATLAGATEYVPGYEGIMTAVEQLVLKAWLDTYRQLANEQQPNEQPTNGQPANGQQTNDN